MANQKVSNNKTSYVYNKSLLEIIFTDVFSLFNIVCFGAAAFLIVLQLWKYLIFMVFVLTNIVIRLVRDLIIRSNNKKLYVKDNKTVVLRNDEEVIISSSEVKPEDIIIVKQSSIIPADGEIVFGQASVNESLLTGNSNNVNKVVGDKVLADSIVTNGYAKIKITSTQKNYKNLFKFRRPKSHSFGTIEFILEILLCVVLFVTIFKVLMQGRLENISTVGEIIGYLMCAIPAGLLVLVSIAELLSASRLNKKGIAVNNASKVEMLARSNVLCVDKTGTITDASLKVKTIEPLSTVSEDQISQILSNLLNATKDNNSTARAIKKYLRFEPTNTATAALPFVPENKYSGASFGTRGTYILGTIDNLNIANKIGITYRAEEYVNKGYSVLLLGHSYEVIKESKFDKIIDPVAFIVLEDNIKNEIIDTLKMVRERDVDIKVISGDDAQVVSELAKSVGILNAEKYISLKDKSDTEIEALAMDYVVFGDVSPIQKGILINAIRRNKKTVTMIGDGVNDIYALRAADCSIAMANGSAEARSVADMVLTDSDLTKLSDVIDEGNKQIKVLEKISALSIVKALFVYITYLFFIFASLANKDVHYPLIVEHLYIYEFVLVFLASLFIITYDRKSEFNRKPFARNIFIKIIPAVIIQIVLVGLYYVLYICRVHEITYLEFSLIPYSGLLNIYQDATVGIMQAIAMSEVSFTLFALVLVFDMFRPINKNSGVIFTVIALITAGLLGLEIYLSNASKGENVFLLIAFNYVTPYQWVLVGFVLVIVSAVYLFATKIVEFIFERRKESKEEVVEPDEN